jgi:tol-pal system protein YbgF
MTAGFSYPAQWRAPLVVGLTALWVLASPTAWAGLFDDDEARRAILNLREQMEAQRQAFAHQNGQLNRVNEETSQLRRGLLELQAQIEALRADLARLHGQNEQLLHGLAEVQNRQKDVAQGMEERLRKLEPSKVSLDGREFIADPAEAREFEAAVAVFRRGDFPTAQAAFSDFVRRYPQSGFKPTALFWLGSAQYARRDYFEAISNFRALLAMAPEHPRAAEAVLSIANCQIELKDNPAARRTLDELVKAYPQSDAAVAAKDRLARIR